MNIAPFSWWEVYPLNVLNHPGNYLISQNPTRDALQVFLGVRYFLGWKSQCCFRPNSEHFPTISDQNGPSLSPHSTIAFNIKTDVFGIGRGFKLSLISLGTTLSVSLIELSLTRHLDSLRDRFKCRVASMMLHYLASNIDIPRTFK